MPKLIIAADPGKKGGIAFRWPIGARESNVVRMPDSCEGIINTFRRLQSRAICLELDCVLYLESLVHFMGKTPMSHMAVYASNWGRLEMCAKAMSIPVIEVPAHNWQKFLGIRRGKKGDKLAYGPWKRKLREIALRKNPHLNFETLEEADCVSDALLILDYATQIEKQPILPPRRK